MVVLAGARAGCCRQLLLWMRVVLSLLTSYMVCVCECECVLMYAAFVCARPTGTMKFPMRKEHFAAAGRTLKEQDPEEPA